ncbi:hypothetical protein Lal_00025785, partial [Lupinus albus]
MVFPMSSLFITTHAICNGTYEGHQNKSLETKHIYLDLHGHMTAFRFLLQDCTTTHYSYFLRSKGLQYLITTNIHVHVANVIRTMLNHLRIDQ